MREAGPTRNRKSGGRARGRGRQGGAHGPDPKGGLGLGDHRKSDSARKRKGEAEVLGRDTPLPKQHLGGGMRGAREAREGHQEHAEGAHRKRTFSR